QLDSEREIISSVYHNRLKKKVPFQADPTDQYALSEGRFWKDKLNYKDLEINSPFNTYRWGGLPPAPICNPGLKSIQAALYPAQTEYLFFVADGKGGHNFFKDYRSHMQIQLKNKKNSQP
ncbi:MAG: endolytic transglycosylase MltG, partial [Elusimicrobia bacterium]|nr:endolytic transglycosylase MltG [Elusimicrobiota bacterium]